jgi:trimeric autotransporter adhesin
MRPGRMRSKARARRRRVAATAAGVSALTVLGGTAYATEGPHGGGWKNDDGDASLYNGGDAKADIDQKTWIETAQLALSNSGGNKALALTANINLGKQRCDTNLSGGNVEKSEDGNTAGNDGGNCKNDASQRNNGTARASVDTGDARSPNSARTTVSQRNTGGASVDNTASNNKVEADDGDATLKNGGDAKLYVDQKASVSTWQGAASNTGHNTAVAGVIGINAGAQSGSTNVSGGNVHWSDDNNTAGNTGGNAGNKASQSNSGSASANIKTGNATASNSSTTTVNQNNSGGASSTNTANGNTVSTD